MKNILFFLLSIISFTVNAQEINKATISKTDSLINIQAFMRLDHKIFGYDKPDVKSRKMIVLSIFTDDVKDNPHHCPFGAYYDTTNMDGLSIKFLGYQGRFVKAALIKDNQTKATVYFEKYWVAWEGTD